MNLTTERLTLRPFREDDVQALYEYSRDEPVGRNAGWKPHESLQESDDILHLVFLDQPGVWAIERRADGRLIGSVGLIADSARQYGSARSLGYALGVPYWGQGYMTEAVRAVLRCGFEQMSLDLISATCYPDNPASRRVLEKCGFQYEGTLHRAELLYNGEIKDHLHFFLTHEMAEKMDLCRKNKFYLHSSAKYAIIVPKEIKRGSAWALPAPAFGRHFMRRHIMYQAGEFIVYGTSGVCRVEAVGKSPFDGEEGRLYYTLAPVAGTETIYIPVDSPVYTRPVISRDQAERLIAAIPSIEEDPFSSHSPRMSSEHYQAALQSHDCRELVQMLKTFYAKSHRGGRRISQIDQRYRKRAEDLLHSELAVALGIPVDEVGPYIARSISGKTADA